MHKEMHESWGYIYIEILHKTTWNKQIIQQSKWFDLNMSIIIVFWLWLCLCLMNEAHLSNKLTQNIQSFALLLWFFNKNTEIKNTCSKSAFIYLINDARFTLGNHKAPCLKYNKIKKTFQITKISLEKNANIYKTHHTNASLLSAASVCEIDVEVQHSLRY